MAHPSRVYIHFDREVQGLHGRGGVSDVEEHTCIYRVQGRSAKAEEAIRLFLSSYKSKFSSKNCSLDAGDLALFFENRSLVDLSEVPDKADLFIVAIMPAAPPSPPPPPHRAVSPSTQAYNEAHKHFRDGRYRKAVGTCEAILEMNGGEDHFPSMRLIGRVHYMNGLHEEASSFFEKVVRTYKDGDDAGIISKKDKKIRVEDRVWFAKCLMGGKRHERALDQLNLAMDIMKDETTLGAEWALDDVVIMVAVCHKCLGRVKESAAITEMIIRRDEKNFAALLNYADIAGRMGKHEDAVSILMRCIVIDQNNKEGKRLIGLEVGRDDGLENVKK